MQKITTFLWFDGNAEEAAQLYTSIFKNSKILDVSHMGTGAARSVMSVAFQLEGQTYHALNVGRPKQVEFSDAISLFVSCETQPEIDALWEKLLAGGGKPIQCGWLKDKFGLTWQIVPSALGKMLSDKDPAKANRVMQAMLPMQKLDLAGLEAAYRG